MSKYIISKQKFTFILMMLIFGAVTTQAQNQERVQPIWWFGESGAANINYYRGTTQMINSNLTVPSAFHKGDAVRPYASLLTEYRPNKTWGGMLNVAYDNRGGKFDEVQAPCGCSADLSTNLSYITVEPSLRLAPFSSAFYIFAGPTVSFNISKAFTYDQEKQTEKRGDWSDIRKTVFSAQAGAGFDIPLSAKMSATQMTLSPFISFQTDLGQAPRTIESWSIYTLRAGIALKFGTGKELATPQPITETIVTPPVTVVEKGVQFSVRAPKVVPLNRQVKETFPLCNSIFFDKGSNEIPNRYVQLNTSEANSFHENQLQQYQPNNLNSGRSSRELAVYYNILNILGDRLRNNANSTITLMGASDEDSAEGKVYAENVKQYLVTAFGIDASRINVEARKIPTTSEQPAESKDLALLRDDHRRVDIESTSPVLLLQVGGVSSSYLKPVEITTVEENPLDSYVIFTADGATESLKQWSVEVTDEQGNVQNYGPYTTDQASVPGNTILGNATQGNYKVVMVGEANNGAVIQKESSVSLMKIVEPKQEGLRYSILFDFDKSQPVASYEKFLDEIVAPLIPENSTVIIQGHTDIIGEENYNHTLSLERASTTQKALEGAILDAGKKNVKFETYGFGEDESMAPFENNLPEKRFYNRTVIIDIVPDK